MLGSTGSIGTQTLEIASEQPDKFKAVALSAGRNINLLTEQVKTHKPEVVAIEDENLIEDLKDNINNFWYYSKNKQEPRLSDRFSEEGAELELPLDIARDIQNLYKSLKKMDPKKDLSFYLSKDQQYRHVLRRVFICEQLPYSEIQDNTISKALMPVDMLRLKLSFFGATRFDPRSDRWVRITMYQGAPLMKEISLSNDSWSYKKIA